MVNFERKMFAFYMVKLSRIVAIYSLNVAEYNGFGYL